jgi:hypothetical protein
MPVLILLALLAAVMAASRNPGPALGSRCALQVALVDGEADSVLPGLIELLDGSGRPVEVPGLLDRGVGVEPEYSIHRWSVLPGPARLDLPRGRYTLRALSGLETELTTRPIRCLDSAVSLRIPLRRFFDAARRGYAAGNTHLHLQRSSPIESDRYLREIPRADGLDLVFVSYLERAGDDTAYTSNRYSHDDLRRMSTPHVHLRGGTELRHNFGAWDEGYGHVLLLNLREPIRPASLGPGITRQGTDGTPLKMGIEHGRSLGGAVIWAHNNWGLEDIPNWVMGRIDAMNAFDGDDSTVAMRTYQRAFYRYLNAGMRVPFSTGTDWFMYDFSRVYVRSDSAFSVERWLGDLRRGRSFITNGPLLELSIDGHRPGDIVEVAEPRSFRVTARAIGRIDFNRLELVRNGAVIGSARSRREAGHFVAELRVPLLVAAAAWVAVRTPSPFREGASRDYRAPGAALNEFGRELFAHTSPIYLRFQDRDVVDSATATGLLSEMAANRRAVEQRGTFATGAERDRVLGVYDEAIAALRRRLSGDR